MLRYLLSAVSSFFEKNWKPTQDWRILLTQKHLIAHVQGNYIGTFYSSTSYMFMFRLAQCQLPCKLNNVWSDLWENELKWKTREAFVVRAQTEYIHLFILILLAVVVQALDSSVLLSVFWHGDIYKGKNICGKCITGSEYSDAVFYNVSLSLWLLLLFLVVMNRRVDQAQGLPLAPRQPGSPWLRAIVPAGHVDC